MLVPNTQRPDHIGRATWGRPKPPNIPPPRLELGPLAPEASALSTELRGRWRYSAIKRLVCQTQNDQINLFWFRLDI